MFYKYHVHVIVYANKDDYYYMSGGNCAGGGGGVFVLMPKLV